MLRRGFLLLALAAAACSPDSGGGGGAAGEPARTSAFAALFSPAALVRGVSVEGFQAKPAGARRRTDQDEGFLAHENEASFLVTCSDTDELVVLSQLQTAVLAQMKESGADGVEHPLGDGRGFRIEYTAVGFQGYVEARFEPADDGTGTSGERLVVRLEETD